MINSVNARTPILALILFVFGIGNVFAANKVVVIPMGSDAAPQSFAVFNSVSGGNTVYIANEIMVQVSLTAPADGVVIVNSTISAWESTASHGLNCGISTAAASDATPTISANESQYWRSYGGVAAAYGQLAGTRGYNVTKGQTSYYRLVCRHLGDGDTGGNFPSITAIFTPSP